MSDRNGGGAAGVVAQEQLELSFAVGPKKMPAPKLASFKISGEVGSLKRELLVDDPVRLVVMSADGEVVFESPGWCSDVGFKRHRPKKEPPWTERKHTLKLGARED